MLLDYHKLVKVWKWFTKQSYLENNGSRNVKAILRCRC